MFLQRGFSNRKIHFIKNAKRPVGWRKGFELELEKCETCMFVCDALVFDVSELLYTRVGPGYIYPLALYVVIFG